MLDEKFIIKICEETINRFKNLNLDDVDPKLDDPMYSWIQNDPDKIKAKATIAKIKYYSSQIIKKSDLNEQKKLVKNIIFDEILTSASMYPILLYPLNNFFQYNPIILSSEKLKISDNQIDNYLKYILINDPIAALSGINSDKNFLNAVKIAETYSISRLSLLIFEECCLNLGVSNIKDVVQKYRMIIMRDIFDLIPKISNNGQLDSSKIKSFKNIGSFFNNVYMVNFLEEN